MISFLHDLFESGNVRCGLPNDSLAGNISEQALALLREQEARLRLGFPGVSPQLVDEAAVWGAISFYRACQALLYRDLSTDGLDALLDQPPPDGNSPGVHYSVDLTFRFLPDLLKQAAVVAPEDPLVAKLRNWANLWPLSSVGCPDVVPLSLNGLLDDPGMLQYYVDRVLARGDASRANDQRVARVIRQSISIFTERFSQFRFLWDSNE